MILPIESVSKSRRHQHRTSSPFKLQMSDPTAELTFQNEVIDEMLAAGWRKGHSQNYDRETALYPQDLIGFVQETQTKEWEKFCQIHSSNPEQAFINRVVKQLDKADPNTDSRTMRTFGTL